MPETSPQEELEELLDVGYENLDVVDRVRFEELTAEVAEGALASVSPEEGFDA